MKHDPITKQRSEWRWAQSAAADLPVQVFQRNVHDGQLRAIVAIEPGIGWLLSISHSRHKPNRRGLPMWEPGRYPTWDEIMHARMELLPDSLAFVMHLPAMDGGEYVALHPTTFHLHQHPEPTT